VLAYRVTRRPVQACYAGPAECEWRRPVRSPTYEPVSRGRGRPYRPQDVADRPSLQAQAPDQGAGLERRLPELRATRAPGEPRATRTRLLAADQSVYHNPARPSVNHPAGQRSAALRPFYGHQRRMSRTAAATSPGAVPPPCALIREADCSRRTKSPGRERPGSKSLSTTPEGSREDQERNRRPQRAPRSPLPCR